jgi:hypothetical protein
MKIAVDKGRSTKPDLELGICGEHGGDPDSIAKCERIGLDYVSCSPFRVPVARLAAPRPSSRESATGSGDRSGLRATGRRHLLDPSPLSPRRIRSSSGRPRPAHRRECALEAVEADPAGDEPVRWQFGPPGGAPRSAESRPTGRPSRSSSPRSAGRRRRTGTARTRPGPRNGVIPTRQAVPPVGRQAIAASIVAGQPDRLEARVRDRRR